MQYTKLLVAALILLTNKSIFASDSSQNETLTSEGQHSSNSVTNKTKGGESQAQNAAETDKSNNLSEAFRLPRPIEPPKSPDRPPS